MSVAGLALGARNAADGAGFVFPEFAQFCHRYAEVQEQVPCEPLGGFRCAPEVSVAADAVELAVETAEACGCALNPKSSEPFPFLNQPPVDLSALPALSVPPACSTSAAKSALSGNRQPSGHAVRAASQV